MGSSGRRASSGLDGRTTSTCAGATKGTGGALAAGASTAGFAVTGDAAIAGCAGAPVFTTVWL